MIKNKDFAISEKNNRSKIFVKFALFFWNLSPINTENSINKKMSIK